jgi:hypothetical protein
MNGKNRTIAIKGKLYTQESNQSKVNSWEWKTKADFTVANDSIKAIVIW